MQAAILRCSVQCLRASVYRNQPDPRSPPEQVRPLVTSGRLCCRTRFRRRFAKAGRSCRPRTDCRAFCGVSGSAGPGRVLRRLPFAQEIDQRLYARRSDFLGARKQSVG